MFPKKEKPVGRWIPPLKKVRIELGCGYVLILNAVYDSGETFEGMLTCTKEQWELKHEGESVRLFEADINCEPNEFYETYLAPFISDPNGRVRNAYLRQHPLTEREANREYAESIWNAGEMMPYLKETCAKYHVGDTNLMLSVSLAYAATRVVNSNGLHISVSGSKGTGKSHAIDTAIQCLPKEAVNRSRLTDKALLYHDIQPCTVLVMDDQELSEPQQEILKVHTSDWNRPPKYMTVYSGKPVELNLAPRCVYITCKASMTGDEQVLDRQLVFWTDESKAQREAIRKALFDSVVNPQRVVDEERDMVVCQAFWEFVPRMPVKISFAHRILSSESMDARNINLLLSLIEAVALLHAPVRERDEEGNLLATEADFSEAAAIMNPLLSNSGGSQMMKLSSVASRVLDYLKTCPSGDVLFSDIRRATGFTSVQLAHAMYGRNESRTDGLLSVCNALEVVTVSDCEGDMVSRRTTSGKKAVRWSAETFRAFEYLARGWFALEGLRG